MHYGSKGWYVEELKKLGVTKHEGRKLQSFKTYFLANLLEQKENELLNVEKPYIHIRCTAFYMG